MGEGLSDLQVDATRTASRNLSLTAQIPGGSPGGEDGLPRWPRSADLASEHFMVIVTTGQEEVLPLGPWDL